MIQTSTLAILLASALTARAATFPLRAAQVEIAAGELVALKIGPNSIPRSGLSSITLTAWTGGNNLSILVPDGAPLTMSAAQRRALLESDWNLGTGLLNPAKSPTAVQATFNTPVINGDGPDMVFFEIHTSATGDPFTLTLNGVTRTVTSAEYGDTGYGIVSHDALSPGATPANLNALLNNPLTLGHEAITQQVIGVAIDFSDFGVGPGQAVTGFSFGSANDSFVDPVLIAGISGGAGTPPLEIRTARLELIPPADTVRFSWPSEPDQLYAVQSSTDLESGAWTHEIVNIRSQGAVSGRTFVRNLDPPRRFFRATEYVIPPGTPQPEILVRSSWQTVNIGDIAHSPGLLQVIRNAIPHARITLWAGSTDRGVKEMIQRDFPGLEIVSGNVTNAGVASNPALQAAWDRAAILIHGSGPSVVAQTHLEAWRQATDKPYGFEGVTITSVNAALRTLLSESKFIYCRDTLSLANIINAGVTAPVMKFGPDGTFAIAVRNEEAATAWLAANGLEEGKFLCVVPRLRYTPYWEINGSAYNAANDAVNQQHKEADHAKLREAIIQWVRQTGRKVVACPEMTYEVALAKELLIDPLPEDVKPHVVWKNSYWITDEAASVYARAAAILSCECHSPIMAMANGVPAIYLRQPTDTIKGQMYRDIGVPNWIMEIDAVTGTDVANRILEIHRDPVAARAYLKNAMRFVHQCQAESMINIRAVLGLPEG